ncbi:doublecortin domain-containing protein 2-like isoform X2 [Mugil cephalus]|uniref:doublecortin domain-containing protein 2-like isoform X2 n=1 Tax=Mugil cephalus TaxID=48193 RepID=UPI001FB85684|nr:doublecortin domain-containing protein 2-like isoform X2 [Mugil cephalus]
MSSEKPNFLSQPVVKNIFMYRNGDPYYEARRIVINQKRVCNFETLLREVTGGIQAPFGAVRNIYTPRGGHKVDSLESLQSGEQYVAAGKEKFKRLDYQQIGSRKKKMMQTLPIQAKPLPQNRIIVSARFLKPIKEPCTIFVVANGDVLDPAMRLLIHQRILGQFDRILEMITEKMGLRVLGGVRSLYTCEGQQVTDGNQLEIGQLYVAVGREKFKKLPYSDILFTKTKGTRRLKGMKAYSLPPIYRFSKQSGNSKSIVRCSDSGDGESKASPQSINGNSKEHLSSIVREISQARLLSLRKRRSGQSLNDEPGPKTDDGNTEGKVPQDQQSEEKLDTDVAKATEENSEKAEEKEEAVAENTTEGDASASADEKTEIPEANGAKEGGEEGEEEKESEDKNDGKKDGEAETGTEDKVEEVKEEVKEEVTGESKEQVKSEEQGSSSTNGDKSEDHCNDLDTGEEQKGTENGNDPERTRADNETKESDNNRSSSSNSNQEKGVRESNEGDTKESGEEEREVNGEVSGEDDGLEIEAELEVKNLANGKDATADGEKGEDDDKENQGRKNKD